MKPVRLPAAATLALPRWALYALGLLYILPGVIGREPWKNDDAASFGIMWTMAHGSWQDWLWPNIAGLSTPDEGPLAFWLGAVCIKLFGWLLGEVLAARVSTVGIFMLGVLSLWYATYHLGRRPDAQPLRLAFGGQPEPDDFGRTLADAAALIYLGCLGLLQHSHETTPDALQVASTAFLLYRTVRYVEKPSLRNAALSGLAIGLMTLSGGWIAPVLLVIALFACTRFLGQPVSRALRDLVAMIAVGSAIAALWLIPAQLLEPYHQQPLNAWLGWNGLQLDWPNWNAVKFFFRVGVWFFWPAWPFACWAVWAWRRQKGALHIVVPLAFVVMGLLLTLFNPQPDQGQLLVLLPPLAVMAAFGLLTMKRGAINAIDWFSVMALTLCAAIIWIFYFAKLIGWPAKAARNVLKLVPGYTPEVGWVAFFVALAATLGWFVLVYWRVSRRPTVLWRAVVLSSGGLILIWILSSTLFLPELNYGKSYASVARQIADKLPPGANCIETNVGPAQRASFAFYGGLPFVGVEGGRCELLLLQDSIKARDNREIQPQHRGKQWALLWEGRRPADRQERFRLYRRAD